LRSHRAREFGKVLGVICTWDVHAALSSLHVSVAQMFTSGCEKLYAKLARGDPVSRNAHDVLAPGQLMDHPITGLLAALRRRRAWYAEVGEVVPRGGASIDLASR